MIGRARELAYCQQLLDHLSQGKGVVVGITGEAGLGKTRLVAEAMRAAHARGVRFVTGECLSYTTQGSYVVWQGLLMGLFELNTSAQPAAQIAQMAEVLRLIDPQLLERLLGNMGVVYRRVGMREAAVVCFQASLATYGETLYIRFLTWGLRHLAGLAAEDSRFLQAEGLFRRTIALTRRAKLPYELTFNLLDQARCFVDQQRCTEAALALHEAHQLSIQHGMRKLQFDVEILQLWVGVLLGEYTRAAAVAQLEGMRATWTTSIQRAAIDYMIWQVDPEREQERASAAEQYRTLYEQSPREEYVPRYRDLTGTPLPAAAPFPEPPPIVIEYVLDMEVLLQRVDQILDDTTALA